eukprot:TRINITY_DN29347_c0_g1_i2.p1 TRINITY_DN29347_c0_g1~~TRINITY_DN29347_c0_g1_i2.p1  ORF type:complete len:356 (-),score=64.94 TRINITY_DN29347_c0_g1_i2:72-1139(-)
MATGGFELLVGCFQPDFLPTITYLETIGFQMVTIFPADAPRVALLRHPGSGVELRLDTAHSGLARPRFTLLSETPEQDLAAASENGGRRIAGLPSVLAPNGLRIDFAHVDPPLVLPPNKPSLCVSQFSGGTSWVVGRAGMRYRDLIPDRWGGKYIASHIHIPTAGEVPDYAHFHNIHFQLIFCWKGWVKVVYEGQGEPFLLRPLDCVLQAPKIRHRVLESSADLQVVEIGCPAEHLTYRDHDMDLPTPSLQPGRKFHTSTFGRFQMCDNPALWSPMPHRHHWEAVDYGMQVSSAGIVSVHVTRPAAEGVVVRAAGQDDFFFIFVPVSYTHLRAHETPEHLVCRLLLEKKKNTQKK